ncbi:phospholemman-like isoform X2 [Arapaima gigas]
MEMTILFSRTQELPALFRSPGSQGLPRRGSSPHPHPHPHAHAPRVHRALGCPARLHLFALPFWEIYFILTFEDAVFAAAAEMDLAVILLLCLAVTSALASSNAHLKDDNSPFHYDYESLRIGGLIFAVVLFLMGILLILSRKCRCKFNQNLRTGPPDAEGRAMKCEIERKGNEICISAACSTARRH